jgi:hypothetical protein
MRKRDLVQARQLDQRGLERTPPRAEPTAKAIFEVVSWLAFIGTVIAVCLTVLYPQFDPMAALLGQFP